VTSQVSHPYRSTDFTQALNILILVSFLNDLDNAPNLLTHFYYTLKLLKGFAR